MMSRRSATAMPMTTILRAIRPPFLLLTPVCVFLGLSTSLHSLSPADTIVALLVLLGAMNTASAAGDVIAAATIHSANTASMASYCRLLRFLLLTGQRLGEAASMDWQDVTDGGKYLVT